MKNADTVLNENLKYDFGFIGAGNMGSALAKAICYSSRPDRVAVSDADPKKADALSLELICDKADTQKVCAQSRFIFIAVKPQNLKELFDEIRPVLVKRTDRFTLISMAAGQSITAIEKMLGIDCPIIRIMPNVACSVGAGMTLCASNSMVTRDELGFFKDAMKDSGQVDIIPEKLIDAASAVSGCGPAYVFMMIEALADGAVACGVPRANAYLYAAKTLEGSAKLMLETEKNPAELKDSVCSPGGTTIAGVRALENGGFRSSVIEAVIAAYQKTKELS